MASMLTINILLIFAGISAGQSNNQLILYDGAGNTGSWISVDNYVEDLRDLGFSDLASSLCVPRGIWLLYDYPKYNILSAGKSGFYWGIDYCNTLPADLNNLVSSVRYAGSPFNFQDDGLNIYEGDWFQGYEVYASNDLPSVELSTTGSIIVTGRNTWTLYDQPNYSGYKVCVIPANAAYAEPGFYMTMGDFGFTTSIQSVRKGCWSSIKYRPVKSKRGRLHFRN